MAGTTVTMYSKANETPANNIAAKNSWGHKKQDSLFINSFVGTGSGGVSYVNSKTRLTNDQQGTIVNTGVTSDIGIDGSGLLVVSDTADGVAKYTRRGDFRQDEIGYWKNGSGQLLKAWKLDGQGKLPQNSSLLSSMEAVNFANTKGLPVQTTIISIAMNLNADQDALRGSGVDAVMNRTGLNSGTEVNDLLFPEMLGKSGLKLGDTFEFTSTPPGGTPKSVEFGGMALAKRPDDASGTTIFGATGAGRGFTFSPAGTLAAPGILLSGQKLSITVSGGATYTFTAMQGQESAANKTFNTINGLAAAINKISALQARVDGAGRLYIGATNANKGLTFANNGGGSIVEELGLYNIADTTGATERFNSLRTLRDAVNKNQAINSLLATIENRDIKISSLLSTSEFTIKGKSLGKTTISEAKINPKNTEAGRATVAISAPGHDLKAGDLVRLEGGLHVTVPNGVYTVGTIDSNGFTVSIVNDDPTAFPAVGAQPVLNVTAASWQKVPGQTFASTPGQITASANGAPNTADILANGHGLLVNDVIYIDGGTYHVGGNDITIPAGYYHVAAVADVNNFTINPTAVAGGVLYPAADALNFRKIGSTAGGAFAAGAVETFSTTIMTTSANPDLNTATVKYYIGKNSGYSVGDVLTLSGLGGPQIIDGVTIDDNIQYKITSVDDASGFIEFAVVGQQGTAADGSVLKSYSDVAFASVRTNNYSRFFEYFNIDQEQSSYEKIYDANNADKNLISGKFDSNLTFSHPLTVYDSLGSAYTIILYFAKLDDNKWSVEVAAQQDANGVFDINNILTENGLLRSGIINFDTNGSLQGTPEGFAEPILIQRNNGSAQSSINIDWNNLMSDIKSGTVSQAKNPNNVEIVQSDGQAAGTLLKLEVDSSGFIVGTFDSGETRKLYQIPLALFANVNGLVAGSNGTYEVSRESGELLLKQAGVGGAGKTLGGVLEASNVDITEELLKVQELGSTIRANARVTSSEFKNVATILNELNQS
jgi:flagellar hook-basal body protein